MQSALVRLGIPATALAFGCARIGSALTPLSKAQSVSLITEAFDLGIRHFDTASIYGQGDSERFLAAALRQHRGEICLSSKAGQRLTAGQRLMACFKPAVRWLAARRSGLRTDIANRRAQGVPRCFEPDYVERSLHASLRRLGTDHLDIFYLHSPEAAVLQDGRLMERIERLRQRGLFRAFGVSCDDAALAWTAAGHPAVQVLQFEFDDSPCGQALLHEAARQGKIAMLRGFAAAAAGHRGAQAQGLDPVFRRVPSHQAIGGLIIGTTRRQHLRDNVAAFQRVKLGAAARGPR